MVVLDTSALSAVMHRLPEALGRLGAYPPGDIVLCAPALAEVHLGLERLPQASRRRRVLAAELELVCAAARLADWTVAEARSSWAPRWPRATSATSPGWRGSTWRTGQPRT